MAATGAEALIPAIMGGFRKRADSAGGGAGGIGDLIGMLGGLGGGDLASNVLGPEPTETDRGNSVLGEIFRSKDVSRTVAQDASAKSGIDPAILKKMLPLLAMLLGGYLSARAGGSGASSAPGTGGLESLLDLDGDGNPLDDIIGMAGKFLR
jgi:hypothetical protein